MKNNSKLPLKQREMPKKTQKKKRKQVDREQLLRKVAKPLVLMNINHNHKNQKKRIHSYQNLILKTSGTWQNRHPIQKNSGNLSKFQKPAVNQ
jgi:hypothetical protein